MNWSPEVGLRHAVPILGSRIRCEQPSLTAEQRAAAVVLFAAGHGRYAVATQLGVARDAVRRLHDRWRIHGDDVLVTTPAKRSYAFELKREVVQRFLAGETKVALAQAYDLSSPQLVGAWVRAWRRDGEDGLRPSPKGRPRANPAAETELECLRRENERLRAEVAYLGKLRALMARERS
jgi:transposase-like protein